MKSIFELGLLAVAAVATAAFTQSDAAERSESEVIAPVDQFKLFISSPPVIEELIYRRKLPPRGAPNRFDGSFAFSTNYAYVQARWQPEAFFYREGISTNFDSLQLRGRLAGFVSSNYWSIGTTNGPIFHRTVGTNDLHESSFVYSMVEDAMYNVSEVLNMGIRHLRIAIVRWEGDTFIAKSDLQNLVISGKLITHTNGQPQQLFVSYSNNVNVAEYVIRYGFGSEAMSTSSATGTNNTLAARPASRSQTATAVGLRSAALTDAAQPNFIVDSLPQRITTFLIIKGQEIELEELVILKLRTAQKPAALASFLPEPFIKASNLPEYVYLKEAIYSKEPNGRLRLVQRFGEGPSLGFRLNFSQSVKRTFYLVTFCLLNFGLLILLGKVTRLANAKTNKQ